MLHAPLPVDGGGTVRHIARETFRHPILSEATTSRDFLWALHSLWKPASPDHCEATLIDTLIVSSGEWFFTNKDGFIVKKTEKGSTPDALRAAFVKMSEGYGIDRSGRPFAVGYTADGRCTPLSAADFTTAQGSNFSGFIAIQPFTYPRAGSAANVNFRQELSVYAGAMDGSLVVMSYKYADAVRVEEGSTGPRPLVSSKVQAINDLMERMTRNVIRFIQSNRGVRVTKLIAEFCHDDNGRLWLCSISELLTVPLPKPVQNSGKPTRKESFTANAHHDSALDATGMLSITSSERPMSPGKVYKPTRRTTSVFEPSADTPLDTLPPAFQSALQRCVETFTVLTVNDVLEFRTFTNPPPAVALVSCALTLLITGEALEWRDARRAMSNGDKMFAAMAAVRADAIPRRRLDALLLLVDNPAFGQEYVRPVNAAAARIADWISSVVKFACLSRGISTKESSRPTLPRIPSQENEASATPVRTTKPVPTFADKLQQRLAKSSSFPSVGATTPSDTRQSQGNTGSSAKVKNQRAAMGRLASSTSDEVALEVSGSFTSATLGVTFPYGVVGRPPSAKESGTPSPVNLVFIHDMFDTCEASQIFMRQVCRESGRQGLVWNYPGQAFTKYSDDSVLSNDFYADCLAELLRAVSASGEFCLDASFPVNVVGIGFGGSIALSFASRHAASFRGCLSGITLVNSFAHVDSQLAAILHSSVNVFSCFPATKPDLPLTYFSRFLFSEAFITKVTKDVALSMYTAVSNPLTLDDRIKVCKAVLRSSDTRPCIPSLPCPLVVVQSLDNVLVSVSNADTILQDRPNVRNIWSSEATGPDAPTHIGDAPILDNKNMKTLADSLSSSGGITLWVKCGHEMRIEARQQLSQLLAFISNPLGCMRKAGVITPAPSPKATATLSTSQTNLPLKASAPSLPPAIRGKSDVLTVDTGTLQRKPSVPAETLSAQHPLDGLLARQADTEAAFRTVVDEQRRKQEAFERERAEKLQKDQEDRRLRWEKEDQQRIESLKRSMSHAQVQRHEETSNLLSFLQHVGDGTSVKTSPTARPITSPKLNMTTPQAIVKQAKSKSPMASSKGFTYDELLAKLQAQEDQESKIPLMKYKEYERIQRETVRRKAASAAAVEAEKREADILVLDQIAEEEDAAAMKIQAIARGRAGRKIAAQKREAIARGEIANEASTKIQAVFRGKKARVRVSRAKAAQQESLATEANAVAIQKVFRGHKARAGVQKKKEERATVNIQRVVRGRAARKSFQEKKVLAAERAARLAAAVKIQSVYRMHVAHAGFQQMQILQLAATQIQRLFRGHMGRQRFQRKKAWNATAPGPDRLKLGIKIIENSKEAYDRQKQEIEALQRAQTRAETRVTTISSSLKESEEDLAVIHKELLEIDQLDRQLHDLSEEKVKLESSVDSLDSGLSRMSASDLQMIAGKRSKQLRDMNTLEKLILDKKAERELKKQDLEAEFAAVFAEVKEKKTELKRLEGTIQEMEAQRLRKDREFARLQRNLMELLSEQKAELDSIREQGLHLEAATVKSAAAAADTAALAKSNQQKSDDMFNSTEELLKFQFMSMSMSYFSSLNMLTGLRQVNADTTSAALQSSADAAATAAAASRAAAIASSGKLAAAQKANPRAAEFEKLRVLEDAKRATVDPLPTDVHKWAVSQVSRWLESLSLGQYVKAFAEGAVDGDFLMELRPEDVRDILGVEHPLHVRKIITARDKLTMSAPHGSSAHGLKGVVSSPGLHLRPTVPKEDGDGSIDLKTVFSQARNSRLKRLTDSLKKGFPVDAVDEFGNTLLLIAAQNVNQKMCDVLLGCGANVNHANKAGNTALHYAFTYDTTGQLAEFLIERGADDSLLNKAGASPYEGVGDG